MPPLNPLAAQLARDLRCDIRLMHSPVDPSVSVIAVCHTPDGQEVYRQMQVAYRMSGSEAEAMGLVAHAAIELAEELRNDLQELLPGHRRPRQDPPPRREPTLPPFRREPNVTPEVAKTPAATLWDFLTGD